MIVNAADLSFSYAEADHPAVPAVSLAVDGGQVFATVGTNEVGKTTLVRLLSGLAPRIFPGRLSGQGLVLGFPLPLSGPPEAAGVLTDSASAQVTGLKRTVAGEIAVTLENRGWRRDAISARVGALLSRFGLEELANRSPGTLSGGELQRALIASAVAHDPRLLLLDDPTLHLDPSARTNLRAILAGEAARGNAVLLTTPTAKDAEELGAEQILEMKAGMHEDWPFEAGLLTPPGAEEELLEFIKVSYTYPSGIRAVASVDLRLNRGEIAGLVGPNGSGKTTLARLALGLLQPHAGEVRIRGRGIRRRHPSENARDVGLVFQNPSDQLFHRTIWDEAVFGPKLRKWKEAVRAELAEAALEATGLLHRREENPRDLGWSKRRLLALACMLATKPPLLVLDEPTAGLDVAERAGVGKMLRKWGETGGGALCVTHDLQWAEENCDYIVRMDRGKLTGPFPPSNRAPTL